MSLAAVTAHGVIINDMPGQSCAIAIEPLDSYLQHFIMGELRHPVRDGCVMFLGCLDLVNEVLG